MRIQKTGRHIGGIKAQSMLEQDYLSLEKNTQQNKAIHLRLVSNVREIVIPQLKRSNTGKNFAQLRQVYQSLILAACIKEIKEGLLSRIYKDKNKTTGITINDLQEKQRFTSSTLPLSKREHSTISKKAR